MEYQGKTIIGIAQIRGSKATTRAGAWKFLLGHLSGPGSRQNSREWQWKNWTASRRDCTGDGRALILGYDINDPDTPGRIWDNAWAENREWDARRNGRLIRSTYGEIVKTRVFPALPRPDDDGFRAAWDLISLAASSGVVPPAYDSILFDHKGRADGDARHQELYDFAPDTAVVCLRETEGTRYGVKTLSKKYFLVSLDGGQISAIETAEPVAKLAKSGAPFGAIIARIRGEAGAASLSIPPGIGFKLLALVDGKMCSIFTGEEYRMGEEKRQWAQNDHRGGFYFYSTPAEAQKCGFPEESKHLNAPRILVKCEVAGKEIRYPGGKRARTSIRPINVIMQ